MSGVLYVMEDSAYPDYIKFGYATDLKRKMKYVVENRPYNSCKLCYESEILEDAKKEYAQLVLKLIENDGYAFNRSKQKLKSGWHKIANKPLLESIITEWLNNK